MGNTTEHHDLSATVTFCTHHHHLRRTDPWEIEIIDNDSRDTRLSSVAQALLQIPQLYSTSRMRA